MTIEETISKKGIEVERLNVNTPADIVDIGFINNDGQDDETQFDVPYARTISGQLELKDLWKGFCKDEGCKLNSVTSITIVG